MTNFECSLKDLNAQESNTQALVPIEDGPKSILSKNNQNNNNQNNNNQNNNNQNINNQNINNQNINNIINDSLFDKIKEEKNIRIILLVIISYLITNSDQFIQLLGNTFPYLVDSGSTNLLGKTAVAVLIGLSVVIFTSFFQVP